MQQLQTETSCVCWAAGPLELCCRVHFFVSPGLHTHTYTHTHTRIHTTHTTHAHAQVLLLDEITVDLDVLGRADLMDFLRQECRERGATIIYVRGARGQGTAVGGHV